MIKRQDIALSLHGLKESINIAEMLLSSGKLQEADVFLDRASQFMAEVRMELFQMKEDKYEKIPDPNHACDDHDKLCP